MRQSLSRLRDAMLLRLSLLLIALLPVAATAQDCAGRTDVLGTSRVLTVDAGSTPRVGRKEFPATLPLEAKDLVLTFDDGPWATTTPKLLDILKAQCVHATFFLLGRNAQAHPQLVRREQAEGHTLGTHSFNHPMLGHLPLAKAQAEIEHGMQAVDAALGIAPQSGSATRFFRFPGFVSTPALLDWLQQRGTVVFGADVWASDWRVQSPKEELKLILRRIAKIDHGIVLLHDTRAETVHMLPALLRALKEHGYRIVHVVPAGTPPPAPSNIGTVDAP
jgi:peptidoglycan/xylan/chitin deacetylase (PgdA/CDA1 family)